MRPVDAHHEDAAAEPVWVAVLTISDTRVLETDESGRLAAALIEAGGHVVVERALVRDEPAAVQAEILRLLDEASVVVTNGGTGIGRRDSTYEAVSELLEKRLDGFGELFRALSYTAVGPAAMMSRAVAGTARGGGVIVSLPGSPDAVELGVKKIVVPELGHLARLAGARVRRSIAAAPLEAGVSEGALAVVDGAVGPDVGAAHRAGGEGAAPRATHLDEAGRARMVDVAEKAATLREAEAHARVSMNAEAFALVAEGGAPKGDVLAVARVAGIGAAKRTHELIPLCHALALTGVSVAFDLDAEARAVRVRATARALDRTGVEMEALTAASVAALTIYDMLKAVDRAMVIDGVCLARKSGGRGGEYVREA